MVGSHGVNWGSIFWYQKIKKYGLWPRSKSWFCRQLYNTPVLSITKENKFFVKIGLHDERPGMYYLKIQQLYKIYVVFL